MVLTLKTFLHFKEEDIKGLKKNAFFLILPILATWILFGIFLLLFSVIPSHQFRFAIPQKYFPGTFKRVIVLPFFGLRFEDIKIFLSKSATLQAHSLVIQNSISSFSKGRWSIRTVKIRDAKYYPIKSKSPGLKSTVLDIQSTVNILASIADQLGFFNLLVEGFSFNEDIHRSKGETCHLTGRLQKRGPQITGVAQIKFSMQSKKGFPLHFPKNTIYLKFNGEMLGSSFVVDQLTAEWGGGKISLSGIIRQIKTRPQISLAFHSNPVNLPSLFSVYSRQTLEGSMNFMGKIYGPLEDIRLEGEVVIPLAKLIVDAQPLFLTQGRGFFRYFANKNKGTFSHFRVLIDNKKWIKARGFFIKEQQKNKFEMTAEVIDAKCSARSQLAGVILSASGYLSAKRWDGNVSVGINHLDCQYRLDFDKAILKTSEIVRRSQYAFLQANALTIRKISIKEKGIVKKLQFHDMKMLFSIVGRRFRLQKLRLSGYGGQLMADGTFYGGRKVSSYFFKVAVKDIHLKSQKITYPFPCYAGGVLNGYVTFEGGPISRSKGLLVAQDFVLADMEPLNKVAEFLDIAELQRISNAQLIVFFDWVGEEGHIRRLDLDSPFVRLRSSFVINTQQWQDGLVALSLPRQILKKSPIFRRLLAIAREEGEWVNFVLRLSGYKEALRVKLEKSSLRDKLKEKLSPGIQKVLTDVTNKVFTN